MDHCEVVVTCAVRMSSPGLDIDVYVVVICAVRMSSPGLDIDVYQVESVSFYVIGGAAFALPARLKCTLDGYGVHD
jgi:hypothetical protein